MQMGKRARVRAANLESARQLEERNRVDPDETLVYTRLFPFGFRPRDRPHGHLIGMVFARVL